MGVEFIKNNLPRKITFIDKVKNSIRKMLG